MPFSPRDDESPSVGGIFRNGTIFLLAAPPEDKGDAHQTSPVQSSASQGGSPESISRKSALDEPPIWQRSP